MTNTDYKNYLIKLLQETIFSSSFQNQIAQINAWRLNPNFNRSFDESEIYKKINTLITISCILLDEYDTQESLQSLEICARTLENISQFKTNNLDNDYIKIISAMCYDLAGYQANAYCISQTIPEYGFNSSIFDINEDNFIIEQFLLILQKKIVLANQKILELSIPKSNNFMLLCEALKKWYSKILKLESSNYVELIDICYNKYLFSNNVYVANLLKLLKAKILISEKRNIHNLVCESLGELNSKWKKYIKLLSNDLYDSNKIKKEDERHSIYELWISQINAIKKGILNKDESFIIQMPTSAGKTFIAELFILNKLINEPQKHVIYISPYKALSSEKENELGKNIEKLGYSVSILPGSYEVDFFFQYLFTVETDLLIATPEKIDLLLRTNKSYFNEVSTIIVDEGHIIGDDESRGLLLEFLIIRVKVLYPDIKFLFISAVVSEDTAQELSTWLSNSNTNVITSIFNKKQWEPTHKLIGRFDWNVYNNYNGGTITYDKVSFGNRQHPFIKNYLPPELNNTLLLDTTKAAITAALSFKVVENGQTLIFCGTKRDLESVSKRLLKLCKTLTNIKLIPDNNKASYFYSKEYFGEDNEITQLMLYGIGIHNGKLPSQIRKSVEQDYKKNKLQMVICTNTIGQGINFPIKNLIIHSVSYGYGFSDLTNKDFWNIVGRAGRAEKETEGQILYVIYKSPKYYSEEYPDEKNYKHYTNKQEYETINSKLYNVYIDFLNKRITDVELLSEIISDKIDTFLLDLINTEIFENNYEEIIKRIFDNSFFNIQFNKTEQDTTLLKNAIHHRFNYFNENINADEKELYSQTGLTFKSTEKIIKYVKGKKESNVEILTNSDTVLINFLDFLANNEISELNHYDLENINIDYSDALNFINAWLAGKPNYELQQEWINLGQDPNELYIFESTGLNYLLPWILSAFVLISSKIYNLEEIANDIQLLPSFLKNGVNKICACLALNHGIQTRKVAIILANLFNSDNTKDFIIWLANLTDYEISKLDLSEFEKDNIRSVSNNICAINYKNTPKNFTLTIKGTFYNEDYKKNSLLVHKDDQLNIKRDKLNNFDPYAILVYYNEKPIGYLPKEDAKYISTEIDINQTEYEVKISFIISRGDYNEIQVILSEKQESQ